MDSRFDVFVGQVGYWLPWHPDVNKIEDQEYLNEDLNTLMKEYKKNEEQKDQFYQEETRARVAEAKEQTKRLNEEMDKKREADKDSETTSSTTENKIEEVTDEEKKNLNATIENLQDIDPWMQRKVEESNQES